MEPHCPPRALHHRYLIYLVAEKQFFWQWYIFFHYFFSQTALLFLPHMVLLGFLLSTLCQGVIRTLVELHQTGTFEGRTTGWATVSQQPYFISKSLLKMAQHWQGLWIRHLWSDPCPLLGIHSCYRYQSVSYLLTCHLADCHVGWLSTWVRVPQRPNVFIFYLVIRW